MVVEVLTVASVGLGAWAGAGAALCRWGRGQAAPERADAVVVLGCRVRADGTPSGALARRTRSAVRLMRADLAPCLVLTGGVTMDATVSEARAAANLCGAEGLSASVLRLDERSRNTLGNAVEAAALVENPGDAHVIVVTDAWHCLRARRAFRQHFGRVTVAPSAPPQGPGAAWREQRAAMREVLALLVHGLRRRP